MVRNQSLYFDTRSELNFEKNSLGTSSSDFSLFSRNFAILKKFESNVLYISKISFEKTDFVIDISYYCLDESKKSFISPSVEKERMVAKSLSMESFAYEFHLEMAFKIFKEGFDLFIEVNYVHFLGFLAHNYRHLSSNEIYLNAAVITYFPRSIKPKNSRDMEDYLKDNAANYGFFCKEIRGIRNLMFYTALEHISMDHDEINEYDNIVAFDSIEPEMRKVCWGLDHVVLGDVEKCDGYGQID